MDNGDVGYPKQEQYPCHPTDDDSGQGSHKVALTDCQQEHKLGAFHQRKPPADDGSSKAHGRVGGTGKVLPPTRPPASPGDFVDIKKGKLEGQQPSKVIPLRVNDLGVDFRPEGKDLIPEIRKQLSQQQYLLDHGFTAKEKLWSDADEQPQEDYIDGHVTYCKGDTLLKLTQDIADVSPGTGVTINKMLAPKEGSYEEGSNGQFVLESHLGQGAFGKVSKCFDRKTHQRFVQKQIIKNYNPAETSIMASLDHPNIAKVFGLVRRKQTVDILMEDAGESLITFVQRKQKMLTDSAIWSLADQGLAALEYLDNRQFRHHDIKPENICVKIEGDRIVLKVVDFGSAQRPNHAISFAGMTPEYLAPEVCQAFFLMYLPQSGLQMNPAELPLVISGLVDVWALALTIQYMYQGVHLLLSLMTSGEASYRNVPNPDDLRRDMMFTIAQKPDMMKEFITDDCSPEMRELLKRMLEGSPRRRPSAQQARQLMKSLENQSFSRGLTLYQADKPSKVPIQRRESTMQLDSTCPSPVDKENLIPLITEPASPMEVEPQSPEVVVNYAHTPIKKKLRDKIQPAAKQHNPKIKTQNQREDPPMYVVPSVEFVWDTNAAGGNMPNLDILG